MTEKLVAGAGIAGWFGFNAVMAFYVYLTRNRPDMPDFGQALVMPMHQHGRVFYVQVWEQRVALIGLGLSLGLTLVAAVLFITVYRQAFQARRGFVWLNLCAIGAFLALAAYWRWPA